MKSKAIDLWLRLLSHPLSLLALTVWLVNDLVLKPLHPTYWTGKLGDFTGLFVLPFLVGVLLSLAARPLRLSQKTVLLLSLAVPGMLFTLVKTLPGFTSFLNRTLATRITQDFSDLVALPVLTCSALLWRSLSRTPAPRRTGLRWLALPFALLVTLADSAAPDFGIKCIQAEGSTLHAASSVTQRFTSTDGGLTWQADNSPSPFTCDYTIRDLPILLEDHARGMQYRFSSRSQVEVSADGGDSFTIENIDTSITNAEWMYILVTRSWNPMLEEGIMNALIDPSSGNLVLAMGHEGALVRSPEGVYTWADLGPYQHRGLEKAGVAGFFTLLLMPLLFCLLAALLAMRTWAHKFASSPWQVVLTVLAWLVSLVAGVTASPALFYSQSLMNQINLVVYPLAFIFLIVLLVISADLLKEYSRTWMRQIPYALGISAIAFLFYVAWYLDWIKSYATAALLSSIVLVVLIIVRHTLIKHPQQPPSLLGKD